MDSSIFLTLLLMILVGFAGSFFTLPIVLELAQKFNFYDRYEIHKIAKSPRPRLGGISIFFGFLLTFFILFFLLFLFQNTPHFIGVDFPLLPLMLYFCSLFFFFLLGLYDDFKRLHFGSKLAVEWLITTVMFFIGFRIELITLPFFAASIPMGYFSYPLTILWIIGIANAINLIDGLDGLAGGIIAIASITIIIICLLNGYVFPAVMVSALLGGILGFLPYNIYPSRILMGDGGSLFAGAILASVSLKISHKASLGIALMIPIIFLTLPILDTVLSFFRRLLGGQNPMQSDNDHIHHRMLRKGFSETKSTNILLIITLIFSLLSIIVSNFRGTLRFLALFVTLLLMVVLLTYLNYIHFDSFHSNRSKKGAPGTAIDENSADS